MYYLYDKWDNIPQFIAISTALHLLIIFIVIYLSIMTPAKRFITPVYIVDIFESAIEKPKKPVTEPVQIKKTEPVSQPIDKVAEEPTKKEPDVIKVEQDKKVDVDIALKMLEEKIRREDEKETSIQKKIKELESFTNIQQKVEELAKKAEKKDTAVKKIEKKEPDVKKQISAEPHVKIDAEPVLPMTRLVGKVSQEMIDLEFKAYYLKLREGIYSKWIFPNDSKKDMMTIIGLKISRAGNLIERYLERSSGSPAFDNSAVRAVEKAAPFPPLPDSFQDEFMEVGIRFCPYGCTEGK
ncbi:MAG: cell envelope integrity protein TolA [Deltaproteobacteria bacterium]|nr:cell envelope integrity protein TolA [Deltaproteobacteria bacterium]